MRGGLRQGREWEWVLLENGVLRVAPPRFACRFVFRNLVPCLSLWFRMSSAISMTTREYALHRGVSDSYIRRMKRKGNLVLADGDRIDVCASDELLNGVTDPVRGGKRGDAEQPAANIPAFVAPALTVVTVQEAVRRERLARARMAELELGEESGQLARVDEMKRAVFTLVRQALNRMHGQSSRLRRLLAKETDPFKIADIIDADVADTCKEMREAATKLLQSPSPEVSTVEAAAEDEECESEDEAAAE